MIEVLINYIPDKKCFGVYEQSTDTLFEGDVRCLKNEEKSF